MGAKRKTTIEQPIEPTKQRIKNCKRFGWEYLGDGLFLKINDFGQELIGYFTKNNGWFVE